MKYNTYSINCDWLSFSVNLNCTNEELVQQELNLTPPDGYRLDKLTGTAIFKRRVIVRLASTGQRVMTILYFPHSKIIKETLCLCEVDNQELYNDGWRRGYAIAAYLHDCSFSNFSRVDVACDFIPTSEQAALISALASGEAYLQRYSSKTIFYEQSYSTAEDLPRTIALGSACPAAVAASPSVPTSVASSGSFVTSLPFCINWGRITSNVKWKLYNKSKEIFEYKQGELHYCKKPWIVSEWQACDFDLSSGDVWRLEVSISYTGGHENDFTGAPMQWADVQNSASVWMLLFASMYERKFVTRKNEGHKKHQNDSIVHLLNMQGIGYEQFPYSPKKYEKKDPNYELTPIIKAMMRQMDSPAIRYNLSAAGAMITAIDDLLQQGNLYDFFYRYYRTSPQKMYEDICALQAQICCDISNQSPNNNIL